MSNGMSIKVEKPGGDGVATAIPACCGNTRPDIKPAMEEDGSRVIDVYCQSCFAVLATISWQVYRD